MDWSKLLQRNMLLLQHGAWRSRYDILNALFFKGFFCPVRAARYGDIAYAMRAGTRPILPALAAQSGRSCDLPLSRYANSPP